jgi:hypothetical protein
MADRSGPLVGWRRRGISCRFIVLLTVEGTVGMGISTVGPIEPHGQHFNQTRRLDRPGQRPLGGVYLRVFVLAQVAED